MPRMYMAIALEERHPITEIMAQTPEIPPNCQWAIFLRNHDELTLEMVTSKERDYMYNLYASDRRARINLGIRRRLAPLLENDLGKIKLMKSLLFSMPGSPILYYGDEIGMGDNIYLGDRDGVRTPMQWSPDRNAGFSRADPQRLYLQPIMDAIYGYEAVNVETQLREPASLLNWTRRMLAVRKTEGAFGRGRLTFLRPGNRKILAYLRELGEEAILCVANLSRNAQPVELDLARFRGRVPVELMGRTAFPPIGELPYLLTLGGHGFLWFRLESAANAPSWHEERLVPQELAVLVLFDGWASLFRERVVPWRIAASERVRRQFEAEVLPAFLAGRRWYAAKGEAIRHVAIVDHAEWASGPNRWLVTVVHAERDSGEPHSYFLPLALAWEDREEERARALAPAAIAKARQQAEVGVVADALGDAAFCRAVVAAIGAGEQVKTARGRIRFTPTNAFAEIAGPEWASLEVRLPSAQSSNTLAAIGERLFLKAYRRLQPGVNPEVEMGRYLTDVARFPHCVRVAGSVEYVGDDGRPATLGLLQAYVVNQGDGWSYTLDYLDRWFEAALAETPPGDAAEQHAPYLAAARTLGVRTAELHAVLARATGDPAFDPEPVTPADSAALVRGTAERAAAALDALRERRAELPEDVRAEADALVGRRAELLERIGAHASDTSAGPRTRVHGDYHLGQVLVAEDDFVIADFEGEPARTVEERRRKHSGLKDVAGMLRSFDYALHSALARTREKHPGGEAERLLAPGAEWLAAARAAFLDGYEQLADGAGLARPREEASGLLEAFLLDKAVYELQYETSNRPDWVRIPLRGLSAILDAPKNRRDHG
jgi:maltose alpha-D-glucosyltransferase/alpha-amylase